MTLPAAIRYNTGKDYMGYVEGFRELSSGGDNSHYEFIFKIICEFLAFFGLGYQWLFVIYAFIIYLPICWCVPKKDASVFISLYILVLYLGSLSVIRQSAAISFIICGIFSVLRNKSIFKYLIWIGLACLMHLSAIIFIPLAFFIKIKMTPYKVMIMIFSLCIFATGMNIIDYIFNNPLFLESKYGSYATNEQFLVETNLGSGLGLIVKLIIPFLFIVFTKKIPGNKQFLLPLSILYISLTFIGLKIYIFNRLVSLFSFIVCFTSYPVARILSHKYNKMIIFCIILVYFIMFQKDIMINQISKFGGIGCSPYITIFHE